MNIVILQDDFPPESKGGAGNLVETLALSLVKEGHTVSVITSTQKSEAEGKSDWQGIAVYRIYTDYNERWRAYVSLCNRATVGKVKQLLKEIKPDVVHIHNVHTYLSYYCLALARKTGAPVVLTTHDHMLFHYGKVFEFIDEKDLSEHPYDFYNYHILPWQLLRRYKWRYNPLRNFSIRRYVRRNVDALVAMSHVHQKELADNGYQNSILIYDGLDATGWPPPEADVEIFRTKYNLHGKKVVLFGGRLSGFKGGAQRVKMLKEVTQKHPNAVLVVAGRVNDYAEKMRTLANEIGIGDHLIYAGWLSGAELRAAYGACDVLIFPSLYLDLLGLVNIEAALAKKPVVATSFGGAQEVVEDGKTGYVVNPYNLKLFAERVSQLLGDSALAARFGEAGYERVTKDFTVERMTRQYIELFTSLQNKR